MKTVRLGRSGLIVTKPAMGCLPLQRCTEAEAVSLLRNAYDGGIRYFDTANAYTDSEEKIGKALSSVRENIVISTKSMGRDGKTLTAHIEESLRRLRTDYIDLFQFHLVREPFGPDSELYEAALKARDRGLIRHIGATAHNVNVAETLVRSGMFETMQYPFSYISNEKELALAGLCAELDVGFIAMKGLAGGLITNARACTAFMNEYPNVVPIWGIQRQEELREWLALGEEDPALDEELRAYIAKAPASPGVSAGAAATACPALWGFPSTPPPGWTCCSAGPPGRDTSPRSGRSRWSGSKTASTAGTASPAVPMSWTPRRCSATPWRITASSARSMRIDARKLSYPHAPLSPRRRHGAGIRRRRRGGGAGDTGLFRSHAVLL